MANDGMQAERQMLPRNETYNWLYSGAELLVISLIVAGITVFRSLKGYCESCHRWMRSVAFHAEPGRANDIAEALARDELDEIPVTEGQFVRIGQPQSWLEFEYCPGVLEPVSDCAAYLTLKDHLGLTESAEVLMYQGRLTPDELQALAGRVSGLAFLGVSAPKSDADESTASSFDPSATPAPSRRSSGLPDDAAAQFDRAGKVEFVLAMCRSPRCSAGSA